MESERTPDDIRVVLFDAGGVLVELAGIDVMLQWLGPGFTAEELWRRWLTSESVRGFETGRIGGDEFAAGVIREFKLKIAPDDFLDAFTGWPVGLFPGALELLEEIPGTYRRALLSNSNVLHWPRVLEDMKLGAAFEHHFVSHLTGRIKPDEDAFLHVTESLDCRPGEVLFLDDNQLNVDAAARVGMHARRVLGPGAARSTLADFGVLPHPPGAPA